MTNNIRSYTNMYLISAFMAYEFQTIETDRTDRNNQRFHFTNDKKPVFVLYGLSISREYHDLEGVESLYVSQRLMLPPNYSDILRSVKSSIHSYRNG